MGEHEYRADGYDGDCADCGEGVLHPDHGDDLCTQCEERPATVVWGAPVCGPCADSLDELEGVLAEEEAADPELAALGDRVDRLQEEWERSDG